MRPARRCVMPSRFESWTDRGIEVPAQERRQVAGIRVGEEQFLREHAAGRKDADADAGAGPPASATGTSG